MSYFPILKAPHCTGRTTLYNFSPNNWESIYKGSQTINLSYTDGIFWHSMVLGELEYGDCQVIKHRDVKSLMPDDDTLPLLSLTQNKLDKISKELPQLVSNQTTVPEYRSTLGLVSQYTETSYQGELNPFPSKASLLTFSPFLQFTEKVENFVLLLNLEKQAENRKVKVEIFDASTKTLKCEKTALSNNITVISLDDCGFSKNDLPVVICREMAAIPLYFSCANQGEFLSLEHTHPPASLVVHGARFGAQKHLKDYWFSECKGL
jgi:hypothetical protein